MKKLLIFVLITSSILLVGCFKNETKNQVEENKLSSQIQTGSVEQVSQNGIISNSGVENNTGIIQLTTSGSFKNELDLCKIDNYGANDFEFSKDNLGIKLFGYKNYKNGWLLMGKPIDYNKNKYFTLTYYAFENVKGGEQVEKIEIYNMNCNENKSKVIYIDKGGLYKGFQLLGINGNKLYTYEYIGDSVGSAYGKNYVLDINTKKYEPVFDYINSYNSINGDKDGEGDVVFNKSFSSALKIQNLDDVGSYWKINGINTNKRIYFIITDLLNKKTSIIEDGIIDYSYMNFKYYDFVKWIDENIIEITLKDGTKKNISVN